MVAPVGIVTLLKASSLRITYPRTDIPGETLHLGLPDRTMATRSVLFSLLGAPFWNRFWLEGSCHVAVLHLPHQRHESWRHDAGVSVTGVPRDSCRVEVLYGTVAASMADLARVMRISAQEMPQRFDGGRGFCSEDTRCSLRVSWSGCVRLFCHRVTR
jgi:hypothetical protein